MLLPMLFELPLIESTSPIEIIWVYYLNPSTLTRFPAFFKYSSFVIHRQIVRPGRVRVRVWDGEVKKQPLTSSRGSRGVAHSHKELNSSAFGGNCCIFVLETRSMHCVKWRKEGCACVCWGWCQSSTLSIPVTLVPAGTTSSLGTVRSLSLHDETVANFLQGSWVMQCRD